MKTSHCSTPRSPADRVATMVEASSELPWSLWQFLCAARPAALKDAIPGWRQWRPGLGRTMNLFKWDGIGWQYVGTVRMLARGRIE